jgi:hypothetical protein
MFGRFLKIVVLVALLQRHQPLPSRPVAASPVCSGCIRGRNPGRNGSIVNE